MGERGQLDLAIQLERGKEEGDTACTWKGGR